MNLLELPNDIIIVIWSYVTHNQDIVSFSWTCKKLQRLAFAGERSLELTGKDSKFIQNYLAKHDLSRLKTLTIWTNDDIIFPLDKIQQLSTCYNLKEFTIFFWLDIEEYERSIVDAIAKMTWLEALQCELQMPENLGNLLVNHTRLSRLVNGSEIHVTDYAKLTQLKHLALLSVYSYQSTIQQVFQLTNLTDLDISYCSFEPEALQELTKLSNLEVLNISGVLRPMDFDWKLLVPLPNLRSLTDRLEDFTQHIHILPALTRLTKLHVEVDRSNPISSEVFFCLTNLQDLHYNGEFTDGSINLAPLVNITELHIKATIFSEQLFPPPHLKALNVTFPRAMVHIDRFFDSLCDTTTLKNLGLHLSMSKNSNSVPNELARFITRLTNLQCFKMNFPLLSGLCRVMSNLPSLRSLHVSVLSEYDALLLKQATQIVELWVGSKSNNVALLRELLPFAVYQYDYDLL